MSFVNGAMQGSPSIYILRVHIRTFVDKEFGDFFVTILSRNMQWSRSILHLRIHIRTIGNKEFDNFLGCVFCRIMQRSPSTIILRIHINAFIQFRLDGSKIAGCGSIVNRIGKGSPHQQQGYDYC
jgi:hypothetical protein